MFTKAQQNTINKAIKIIEDSLKSGEAMHSSQEVKNFLRLNIAILEHEVFAVMLLNTQHNLIEFVELFRGTIDGAAIYPREVVKLALRHNAAALIFAHNHPSGIAQPSEADKAITRRLVEALRVVDIRVLDHLIVAPVDVFSFAEHGLL